jgi:hypothetical protein
VNGRILMRSLGDVVAVMPEKKLGGSLWTVYLAACHGAGARYRKDHHAQVAPMPKASAVALALEQAGFEVQLGIGVEVNLERDRSERQARELADVATTERLAEDRGLRLFPFQHAGVEWLAPRYKALLADEMGLGKTVQVLAALPRDSRVIVVCPAAVKGVWQREFRTWRPEYFVQVLHGLGSFRWPLPRAAAILNFDILPDQVIAPPGTVLVCDEAHFVKSPHAERTKKFRALADGVMRSGGRVWLLTGTPLKNRPPDLWNVLRAARLEEDAFGSYPQFVRMFGGRKGPFGMTWPDQATHPIDPDVPLLLQRVSLRRHRRDVLPELPEKTVRDIPVLNLPHDTRKVCDEALEALARLGINLEEVHDLTELTKHGKVAFDILAKARAALAVATIPTMEALIAEYEAEGEPLVVFSAHRGPVEAAGARPGWGIITGAVNATTRTETVAAFQAGKLRGIALTIGAGGVGLTLTRSPHALFVDLAWTPADNSQAEDRVYRIGQTRGVTITRLIPDHQIAQHVTKLLTVKQRTIEASVEASAVGGAG